jgi:hypothetical protein
LKWRSVSDDRDFDIVEDRLLDTVGVVVLLSRNGEWRRDGLADSG